MFSIKESLRYGWDTFKNNKALWVATLAFFVLMIVSGGQSHTNYYYRGWLVMHYGYGVPSFGIISLLAFIALLVARVGYTKLLLKVNDGEKFDWPKALETMFNTHGVFWKFIGTSVVFGLMLALGTILLIIPGIYVLTSYVFAPLIVIDNGMGVMVALKESAEITKGNKLKILLFIVTIVLVNVAGAILLSVGLLISMPVSMLASIFVYRKLLAAKASPATV